MNKNTNYTIDFESKKITITKRFGKAASQIDSPEFKTMQRLRTEFAEFKFAYKTIERKENKKSYKGLSIAEMTRFISNRSEEEQEMFKKVLIVTENKQGKYATVKKWFLDRYKDAYSKELEEMEVA